MSQRDVERTLGRLLTDEDFRDEFFLEPGRSVRNDLDGKQPKLLEQVWQQK